MPVQQVIATVQWTYITLIYKATLKEHVSVTQECRCSNRPVSLWVSQSVQETISTPILLKNEDSGSEKLLSDRWRVAYCSCTSTRLSSCNVWLFFFPGPVRLVNCWWRTPSWHFNLTAWSPELLPSRPGQLYSNASHLHWQCCLGCRQS